MATADARTADPAQPKVATADFDRTALVLHRLYQEWLLAGKPLRREAAQAATPTSA